MSEYYELLFWCARVFMVLCGICTVWAVGLLFYERYVEGNIYAFQPERRVGPADRRAELSGH